MPESSAIIIAGVVIGLAIVAATLLVAKTFKPEAEVSEAVASLNQNTAALKRAVKSQEERKKKIMANFSDLQAAVENNAQVIASAITLINGIADKIDAAVAANDATDNSALTDLSVSLRTQSQSLADAVAANTAPPA